MKPFFSIIIPTRQRHETLPFAMQTVLEQDFDDYELIISDNCSSLETSEVVNRFKSKKIKYIRSEIPLAMTDNWELAISNATGEYIIVFGDDDGLIKNALSFLYKFILFTKYKVITWERVYYSWDNITVNEVRNELIIPDQFEPTLLNGNKIIKKVINLRESYTKLPMLYNSAISHSVIKELKEKTGRVFSSITPDIYSGYAFAYLIDYYPYLGVPITINGGSSKSGGVAGFSPQNSISEENINLNQNSSIKFHPKMPLIRSITASIIEPFLMLKDLLKITEIKINRKEIINKVIESLVVYNEKERIRSIELIKESCKDDKNLKNFVDKKLKKFKILITKYFHEPYKRGRIGNSWVFDASKFYLSNIFQVSEFVYNFYDYSLKEKESFYKRLYKRFRAAARILLKGK